MNTFSTSATGPNRSRLLITVMGILIFSMITGCNTGSYGRLKHSREVTDTFNAYEVPEGYRYFYSGPDSIPFAFIGVADAYTLQSSLWKPVNLTPSLVRSWIDITRPRAQTNLDLFGAEILGPNGEQIGLWYAVRNWRATGTVKLGEGNTVYITTPDSTAATDKLSRTGSNR